MYPCLSGLEAWPLLKSDFKYLDFIIISFLMKLFNTNNMDHIIHRIVNNILLLSCQVIFGLNVVDRFERKFAESSNSLYMWHYSLCSLACIVLLVKLYLFLSFCVLSFMVNKDVYY